MKRLGFIFLAIFMTISLSACVYTEEDLEEAEQSGYNDGYSVGYDEGYDEGYEIGYDEGYTSAEEDYSGDDSYDDAPDEGSLPDTAVFVTPHGEKYHEGWCQYVSGRYDLTYFNNADDAMSAGYAPCSVCH